MNLRNTERNVSHLTWLRVALAMFAVAWGANMFASLLGVYRDHLSDVEASALFGAYAIGLIPALLAVAPASDRWGRRAVIRPAVALSAVGSLALLYSENQFSLLFASRVLVGVAAGATLGPGTAWLKELTDRSGSVASGAVRATVTLTAGFALGPFLTGITAQWLPGPEVTSYTFHILLAIVAGIIVWTVPETAQSSSKTDPPQLRETLLVLRKPAFVRAILPTAPWVFGAASLALAVEPTLLDVGEYSTVVAGSVAVLALGTGIAVQPWARARARKSQASPFRYGVYFLVAGLLAGGVSSATTAVPAVIVSAMLLGAAYGFLLTSGLNVVDEIAGPRQLAAVTGVFYALTYVGFGFPVALSTVAVWTSTPTAFLFAAAIGCTALIGISRAWPPHSSESA